MANKNKKTNHSNLKAKVDIRLCNLPEKSSLVVLDCYAGMGEIWQRIRRLKPDLDIRVVSIDKSRRGSHSECIIADNLQILKSVNLNEFDIIDLDAYGIPWAQLSILFDRGYKGTVFVTFIQSVIGVFPKGLLRDLGFTELMISSGTGAISSYGWDLIKQWLASRGIKQVIHRSKFRTHYVYLDFSTDNRIFC